MMARSIKSEGQTSEPCANPNEFPLQDICLKLPQLLGGVKGGEGLGACKAREARGRQSAYYHGLSSSSQFIRWRGAGGGVEAAAPVISNLCLAGKAIYSAAVLVAIYEGSSEWQQAFPPYFPGQHSREGGRRQIT